MVMKKLFLTLIVAFATLCGFAQEIANTYWRNNATGDWFIGIADKYIIYDCRFWEIENIGQKKTATHSLQHVTTKDLTLL